MTEPIDPTTYYTVIGSVPNSYDIYRTGWGADWPVASTVVPNLLDGRQIGNGDPDYSQYLSTSTDAQIDAINANPDVASAAKQWNTLAQQVIANDVPLVPFGFDKFLQIYGTGLGGIRYNQVVGAIDANSVYVTNP